MKQVRWGETLFDVWHFFAEHLFIGLAYQGKDFVFTFITEYSSLKDFGPLGKINYRSIFFYMRIFQSRYFGLC
jgi:hypothetical protein